MPAIGSYHPEIVHFVIALLVIGVVLRLVALTGRLAFAGAAAATLIILGTLATVAAVKSGDDAHGPVERIPGAREAASNTKSGVSGRGTSFSSSHSSKSLASCSPGRRLVRRA